MKLSVTYLDGRSEEVTLTPGDLIAFERKFDLSFAAVEKDPRMEHVVFLAWNGLRRTGRETRSFDEFIDDVGDFNSGGEGERPLPPPPGS
jgi:hypothetical protein